MTHNAARLRIAFGAYLLGCVVAAVTLVTCSRECRGGMVCTYAGLHAAMERLP